MKTIKLISVFILFVLLTSCVTNYRPLPGKHIKVSDKYAIIKTKSYTAIIDYRYWVKEPQNLSDYFTTFYLTGINNSNKPITIKPSDIYLIDQNGKQYDVVPIEEVYHLLFAGQENMQMIYEQKDETEYKNMILERQESRKNIMSYSFSFGKLLVGAKKTGYLFFNHLPSDNKLCKIAFKNHIVKFMRTK